MGNRISWNKGKKMVMDALNDQADDTSQKLSDSDGLKHQINMKHCDKYVANKQQLSISQESFPEKLKSTIYYEQQDKMMIHCSKKIMNDRKWKSDSETNVRHLMRPKCRNSKYIRNDAKRNQSQTRIRSSNHNGSRQSFRNCNSKCHPISSQGREIIQACFGNHHNKIGYRICMRVFEKRPDYQSFVFALGKERWLNASAELRDYLNNVVSKVHDVAAVKEMSRHYGERHVPLKKYGFKPDFWVSIADAMAIECIILDMANHQPTETVMAWSQLTSLMFTSIRDGYYAALRFQRQTLKSCKSSEWHLSVDSIKNSNKSTSSIVEKSVS
uniref:GLOBIN domain-containing protein n=1 Tax=Loa loa TaxID=7209 RepID=A0A1I7VAM6_LOALO